MHFYCMHKAKYITHNYVTVWPITAWGYLCSYCSVPSIYDLYDYQAEKKLFRLYRYYPRGRKMRGEFTTRLFLERCISLAVSLTAPQPVTTAETKQASDLGEQWQRRGEEREASPVGPLWHASAHCCAILTHTDTHIPVIAGLHANRTRLTEPQAQGWPPKLRERERVKRRNKSFFLNKEIKKITLFIAFEIGKILQSLAKHHFQSIGIKITPMIQKRYLKGLVTEEGET